MTQDGELRVRTGANTIQIPVLFLASRVPGGGNDPPIVVRVGQGGNVRHCALVPTADAHATAVRIKTSEGTFALSDTDWTQLDVTLADLAGDFAAFNGVTTVTFGIIPVNPNIWTSNYPDYPYVSVVGGVSGIAWRVLVRTAANCHKFWNKTSELHTPCGTYSELSCEDVGCDDGDTCENSAGATCSVTIT